MIMIEYKNRQKSKNLLTLKPIHKNLQPSKHSLKYQKGRFLWKGIASQSFQVRCLESSKIYELKIITNKTQNDRALLKNEQKILNQLSNSSCLRNIIHFSHIHEQQDNLFSFLQITPNGTLKDLIEYNIKRNHTFEEPQIRYLLRQAISALQYLQLNNIVHRNIKSNSFLLDQMMRLKLSNFELALKGEANKKPESQVKCGGIYYMAPEVLMTYDLRDKYSFEADVWSLGVVLYVLMFLKYPFEGGKNQIQDKIMYNLQKMQTQNNYSKELNQLVFTMLNCKKADQRYSLLQIIQKLGTVQTNYEKVRTDMLNKYKYFIQSNKKNQTKWTIKTKIDFMVQLNQQQKPQVKQIANNQIKISEIIFDRNLSQKYGYFFKLTNQTICGYFKDGTTMIYPFDYRHIDDYDSSLIPTILNKQRIMKKIIDDYKIELDPKGLPVASKCNIKTMIPNQKALMVYLSNNTLQIFFKTTENKFDDYILFNPSKAILEVMTQGKIEQFTNNIDTIAELANRNQLLRLRVSYIKKFFELLLNNSTIDVSHFNKR